CSWSRTVRTDGWTSQYSACASMRGCRSCPIAEYIKSWSEKINAYYDGYFCSSECDDLFQRYIYDDHGCTCNHFCSRCPSCSTCYHNRWENCTSTPTG